MNDTETPATRRQVPRVTVEAVLWGLIAVIALALRLGDLDAAPLSAHEAREAMLAWRAVTGQGMPEADYSPLLFLANSLLFALCGASDMLARLWPAVCGSALVLAPVLFRRHIGRLGALAAGLYLAISPTALFASRQLDGAVVTAAGGAALLGGVVRFFDTGKRSWLAFSAVGSALAVTASPSAYGMLLALGLAWAAFAWAWPDGRAQRWWKLARRHLGYAVALFLLAGLIFSTGLGWNPAGLGVTGDLASSWFARLGLPTVLPLAPLVVYEPLALLLGLGGLVRAVLRGRRFGVFLGLWACLGILLQVLASGAPADLLWAVVPLALLAGLVAELFVRKLSGLQRGWRGEWAYALVVCVLCGYLYLRLARYAKLGDLSDLLLAFSAFVFPAALLGLAAAVFALTSGLEDRDLLEELLGGGRVALRGIALGLGIALLASTISAGWGAARARPADAGELLAREPTAVEVRDLVWTLQEISVREARMATTLPFVYEAAPDSVLAWYLRDFSAARRVDRLDPEEVERIDVEGVDVVITSGLSWPQSHSDDSAVFVGQDFVLRRVWDPQALDCLLAWPPCSSAFDWLLFRRSSTEASLYAALWLRADAQAAQQTSHSH